MDFDASSSQASGSSIATYAWSFGDGTTGSGIAPRHVYGAAGSYPVALTVTTTSGATSTTSRTIEVTAVAQTLAHVASTSVGANSATQRLTVPAGVAPGDRMLLHLTLNDSTVQPSAPPGWTAVDAVDGAGVIGRSWTRVATTADSGASVTVAVSGAAKGVLSLSAYRSSTGASAVVASAASVDAVSGTSHTAPSLTLPASAAWVVSSWVAKSSADTELTLTSPGAVRTTVGGTGGGRLTSLVADSGAPRAAGAVAGAIATSSPAVSRTVMFTTAISPE